MAVHPAFHNQRNPSRKLRRESRPYRQVPLPVELLCELPVLPESRNRPRTKDWQQRNQEARFWLFSLLETLYVVPPLGGILTGTIQTLKQRYDMTRSILRLISATTFAIMLATVVKAQYLSDRRGDAYGRSNSH